MIITRRKFLKTGALAGIGSAIGAATVLSAPSILTRSRVPVSTGSGTLTFRPQFVQKGRGPHLLEWAYASDTSWDAFHSDIASGPAGVTLSNTEGKEKFGINVRWNVEGFGYLFITADNGGEYYELPPSGKTAELNLNYELAASRVIRNRTRMASHMKGGWTPSRELHTILQLSEELLADARKSSNDERRRGELAQGALTHALHSGEKLEREKAEYDIARRGCRPEFYVGCDARGFYEMHQELFLERFAELFNFATITYVPTTNREIEDFESTEGNLKYPMRDLLHQRLREKNITVEGRLLHWFHTWVTPEWQRSKTYDQLRSYVEKHTREVIGHYGDGMYAWEIVNEIHDWANECRLTPDQIVELTRLACDVAKSVAPKVHRMINNCCPYAEYVQMKQWSGQEALYPQRTPVQFIRDLADAGVDFTIIGQQMYFPFRDLQDMLLLVERYERFGKRVQISEIGASSGPTDESVKMRKVGMPKEPFVWHRPWDEELQADWLEGFYTLAYSKSFVEGVHWFDFVDPYYFIDNGGLLRSSEGGKKAAFDRLLALENRWKALPTRKGK
jgi:endo-1,4-beta-xylanase